MDIDVERRLVCGELSDKLLLTRRLWTDCPQIGKELLLPELPLRIRLIGLRVTKLKDLREDADAKPGSIKRVRRRLYA